MADNRESDGEQLCALGLDAERVYTEFEKINNIKDKLEDWEKEGGVLFRIDKTLKEQNGRLRSNEIKIAVIMSSGAISIAVLTILKLTGHI